MACDRNSYHACPRSKALNIHHNRQDYKDECLVGKDFFLKWSTKATEQVFSHLGSLFLDKYVLSVRRTWKVQHQFSLKQIFIHLRQTTYCWQHFFNFIFCSSLLLHPLCMIFHLRGCKLLGKSAWKVLNIHQYLRYKICHNFPFISRFTMMSLTKMFAD